MDVLAEPDHHVVNTRPIGPQKYFAPYRECLQQQHPVRDFEQDFVRILG